MAIIVERKRLSFWERTYLPQILSGLYITLKNFFAPKVTLEYPDQQPVIPQGYRGAPVLVCDSDGRHKCVSCQLCEFVCPSKAIKVTPSAIPEDSQYAFIEKGPADFQIDMSRCIYCGLCQEACPEQAIFMSHNYLFTPTDKTQAIHNKAKLYELGGTRKGLVNKWNQYK